MTILCTKTLKDFSELKSDFYLTNLKRYQKRRLHCEAAIIFCILFNVTLEKSDNSYSDNAVNCCNLVCISLICTCNVDDCVSVVASALSEHIFYVAGDFCKYLLEKLG